MFPALVRLDIFYVLFNIITDRYTLIVLVKLFFNFIFPKEEPLPIFKITAESSVFEMDESVVDTKSYI